MNKAIFIMVAALLSGTSSVSADSIEPTGTLLLQGEALFFTPTPANRFDPLASPSYQTVIGTPDLLGKISLLDPKTGAVTEFTPRNEAPAPSRRRLTLELLKKIPATPTEVALLERVIKMHDGLLTEKAKLDVNRSKNPELENDPKFTERYQKLRDGIAEFAQYEEDFVKSLGSQIQ